MAEVNITARCSADWTRNETVTFCRRLPRNYRCRRQPELCTLSGRSWTCRCSISEITFTQYERNKGLMQMSGYLVPQSCLDDLRSGTSKLMLSQRNMSLWVTTVWCYIPVNSIIRPRPLIGRGIKWCFCLTSVWHLSVAYIGPKSRRERPSKTKIGT